MKKMRLQQPTRILRGRHLPDIHLAAHLIQSGELVAVPTETVYGLAGLGHQKESLDKIYTAKGRPLHNPLILHVATLEQALQLFDLQGSKGQDIQNRIEKLANLFWPGPLTLVAPKAPHILEQVTAGLDSLAVRIPAHPATLKLLEIIGSPLAAPSANRSNRPSPTCVGHVSRTLNGKISAILDGGRCQKGLESTVLDLRNDPIQILRAGAIDGATLQKVIGKDQLNAKAPGQASHISAQPRSPGQHHRHYAPAQTLLHRMTTSELAVQWPTAAPIVLRQETSEALEKTHGLRPDDAHTWLMPNQVQPYAAQLYQVLYQLEMSPYSEVWVEDIQANSPRSPWWAIRDRWLRACHEND